MGAHCIGDINGDGYRDRYDYGLLALAYGSVMGSPRWNPAADLVGDPTDFDPYLPDGDVDRYDFGVLAQVYGVPCPPPP